MADPEKRAKRNRTMSNWGRNLRTDAVAVLGDSCACCGEHRVIMLDIDHINNNGSSHRRSLNWNHYEFYRQVADGKTEGLQLLCCNCNYGKSRNGGICPHQTERMAVAVLCA